MVIIFIPYWADPYYSYGYPSYGFGIGIGIGFGYPYYDPVRIVMVVFIWVMVDTTVVIILIILLIMVVVTTRGIVVITMYTAIRCNMADAKGPVLSLQTGIKMNQVLRIPEEMEVVLHQPEDLIQEEGQSQDHNPAAADSRRNTSVNSAAQSATAV